MCAVIISVSLYVQLSCSIQKIVSLQLLTVSGSYNFSTPFSMIMPVLWEDGYDTDVPFNAYHSHSLLLYASWPVLNYYINHHLVQRQDFLVKIERWIHLQVYQ